MITISHNLAIDICHSGRQMDMPHPFTATQSILTLIHIDVRQFMYAVHRLRQDNMSALFFYPHQLIMLPVKALTDQNRSVASFNISDPRAAHPAAFGYPHKKNYQKKHRYRACEYPAVYHLREPADQSHYPFHNYLHLYTPVIGCFSFSIADFMGIFHPLCEKVFAFFLALLLPLPRITTIG